MKPSGKSGGKPGDKITGLCIEQRPVCLCSGGSSPRQDAPEVSVGRVAVPKVRYKTISPRRDASGVAVGRVVVPKTVQKPPSPRRDASGAPVGKVAVPKTGQKPPFATRGCLWIICGPTLRADGSAEHPIRTSTSIKKPDSMDTHPLRTSTSIKQPDSMDAHPIRTSTDR